MRVLRTYVYADGLNLYFRALRHGPAAGSRRHWVTA